MEQKNMSFLHFGFNIVIFCSICLFVGWYILKLLCHNRSLKENFEDTKGVINNVNRRWRDDNTMTKRKGRKGQTMIYKTLHRKQQIGQHEPY
jgi:hypothetical protein